MAPATRSRPARVGPSRPALPTPTRPAPWARESLRQPWSRETPPSLLGPAGSGRTEGCHDAAGCTSRDAEFQPDLARPGDLTRRFRTDGVRPRGLGFPAQRG